MFLLEYSDGLNYPDFYNACTDGDLNKVQFYINSGADPNYIDEFHGLTFPALTYAAIDIIRNKRVIEYLLSEGADLNLAEHDGWTPFLHITTSCVQLHNLEIFELLLKYNGDFYKETTSSFMSVASSVIVSNWIEGIELLLKYGFDWNHPFTSSIPTYKDLYFRSNLSKLNHPLFAHLKEHLLEYQNNSAELEDVLTHLKDVFSQVTKSILFEGSVNSNYLEAFKSDWEIQIKTGRTSKITQHILLVSKFTSVPYVFYLFGKGDFTSPLEIEAYYVLRTKVFIAKFKYVKDDQSNALIHDPIFYQGFKYVKYTRNTVTLYETTLNEYVGIEDDYYDVSSYKYKIPMGLFKPPYDRFAVQFIINVMKFYAKYRNGSLTLNNLKELNKDFSYRLEGVCGYKEGCIFCSPLATTGLNYLSLNNTEVVIILSDGSIYIVDLEETVLQSNVWATQYSTDHYFM